jgi:cytochrome P450
MTKPMTNKKTKQKTSRFFLGLGLGISLVTINALANTPLVDKNGCDQALEVASETNEVALPKLPLYAIGIEMAKAKGDLITLLSNLHQRAGTTFTAMAPLNLKAVVVTADPDAIRAILRDTDKTTESKFSKDPLQVKPLQKFGGKNTLVSAPYEIWKPQRQKLAPAFTPKEIGNADYSAQIGKIVDSHIFAVKAGELNYQKWIKRTSLDAILKLLFGYEAPASQLDLLTSDNINVFDKRLIAETLNPFPVQLHELPNVTGFQRLAEDVMKHMEANSDSSKGFMSLLMGLKGPDGAALTREEIKNQIRLFIFAGHDTTAHTLTWAFEEIFSNSAIKEKLESLIQAGDKEKTLEYVDEIWNEAPHADHFSAKNGKGGRSGAIWRKERSDQQGHNRGSGHHVHATQ